MTATGDVRRTGVRVFSRSEAERLTPQAIETARADGRTRVLVLVADTAPLSAPDRLLWSAPQDAPSDAEWVLLGRDDDDGAPLLVAVLPAGAPEPFAAPSGWQSLRRVGHHLDAFDAAALVAGVSLGRWIRDAAYCPSCGSAAELVNAGWARACAPCGRQQFPRTDPAVIVVVTSASDPDKILLGNNALWEPERFSCFAGFVEAGESAEDAVRREVREESGVHVAALDYRGSQSWPYPRSLMLGYVARAADDADAVADGDEIRLVRWFTRDEIRDALAGESDVVLPGPASISHALIRGWCEDAA